MIIGILSYNSKTNIKTNRSYNNMSPETSSNNPNDLNQATGWENMDQTETSNPANAETPTAEPELPAGAETAAEQSDSTISNGETSGPETAATVEASFQPSTENMPAIEQPGAKDVDLAPSATPSSTPDNLMSDSNLNVPTETPQTDTGEVKSAANEQAEIVAQGVRNETLQDGTADQQPVVSETPAASEDSTTPVDKTPQMAETPAAETTQTVETSTSETPQTVAAPEVPAAETPTAPEAPATEVAPETTA